jgi:aspartyl-tRNA synthetase
LLVADERPKVWHVLGLLRLELGRPRVTEGGLRFLWVVDFPLFEALSEDGRPVPAHHPFTMPHADDVDLLDSGDPADLLTVRSQAYDLVLNGWELGSGSVRIHRADIQQRIFGLLGLPPEEVRSRFGFLLDAFRYGAPPHAGFAFGIDRLTALLAGEENIREVIAFPKTQSGADPLTHAPTDIDARHLDELGLRLLPRARADWPISGPSAGPRQVVTSATMLDGSSPARTSTSTPIPARRAVRCRASPSSPAGLSVTS